MAVNEAYRARLAAPRDIGRRAVTVEELSALYHDGYHRFVRVAEAITRDTEEARDAVQEGFSNALRGLER